MTYVVGGKVQALDYNTFANAAANINPIWGQTNAGQTGYGQANIANVAIGDKITSTQWTYMVDSLNATRRHQINANTNIANTQVEVGDKVVILNGLVSDITNAIAAIQVNPLNAFSQGGTSASTGQNNTSWQNILTFQIDVPFGSYNQARWFFNSGGQIGISVSHGAAGGINDLIAGLCNNMGTIWLSAPNSGTVTLAGTTYNGVTRMGGSGGTVNTNNGFYSLGTQTLYTATSGSGFLGGRYASSFITLSATVTGGTIRFTLIIDEVWTGGVGPQVGVVVGTPTTVTCTIRQPETTNLINTWGTPVPSITIPAGGRS